MPLQPIETTASEVAKNAARQLLGQIGQVLAQGAKLRSQGVAGTPARAAQTLPDGRVIPAQEARPGCTGAEVDAALGSANVAALDAAVAALS